MLRTRMSLTGLVLVMGVLLVPGAAAQVPTQDSVTGSLTEFISGPGDTTWHINAASGPSGERPTGNVELEFTSGSSPVTVNFQVVCLQITANRAVIGIRPPSATNVHGYLVVVDEPGDVQDRLLSHLYVSDPNAPATCADFDAQVAGTTPPPAQSGSVVVVDAQPFPTSKDQCQNGGWRNFPGFKNQGACVSIVATGGKKPPAGT